MITRLFYVVYVGEPILQITLDAIRYVANPCEKGLAHITVRGPYLGHPNLTREVLTLEGEMVRVKGVGDFFDSGQNTVYLKCESPALRRRWDKPDFGYRPHITIYDGPSLTLARKIRDMIAEQPVSFQFRATRLSPLFSKTDAHRESLRAAMGTGVLSWLLAQKVSLADVASFTEEERIRTIERLWRDYILGHFSRKRNSQYQLFPLDAYPRFGRTRFNDLYELVRVAYLKVHSGNSIDRIIADPDLNAVFVQECWRLGAEVRSAAELNRALLNARKQGKIGPVPGVVAYSLPRAELDKYLFASEVALRLVQDEEYYSHQLSVSLDRILCEPTLSYRFDQLARAIAPGFRSADYRWAAIAIRKGLARRPSAGAPTRLNFVSRGWLADVNVGSLCPDAGLFWLRSGSTDVYIGHAQSIRGEIDRVRSFRLQELPVSYGSSIPISKALMLFTACVRQASPSVRDFLKSNLVEAARPTMNVLQRQQ